MAVYSDTLQAEFNRSGGSEDLERGDLPANFPSLRQRFCYNQNTELLQQGETEMYPERFSTEVRSMHVKRRPKGNRARDKIVQRTPGVLHRDAM